MSTETKNSFEKLFIEKETEQIMSKIEEHIRKEYFEDEKDADNVWEEVNITLDGLNSFFYDLIDADIIPEMVTIHFTASDIEESYENMASRVVIFSGLDVIDVFYFDDIINLKSWEYEGLKKDGIQKMVESILMYHHYGMKMVKGF